MEVHCLYKYTNGNVEVEIFDDGTKKRTLKDSFAHPEFPESIDVKITNYCDLGCKFCHENSTVEGTHADLNILLDNLKMLPAGIELAIGGGNPLSHPELISFLSECKQLGFICNLTINQGHLSSYRDLINSLIKKELIYGLGISITSSNFKDIIALDYPHIVFHIIAGVHDISIIDKLISIKPYPKVLVLGYKKWGLGVAFHNQDVDNGIKKWKQQVPRILDKVILSFDNLAIEQLDIKRLLTPKGWSSLYMGDDFSFTMYADAVKQEWSPTSRNPLRVPFKNESLLTFFNTRHV